ncbi:hypothetical protein RIR_jg8708.t1 [Rhizophagus irregularis DAOM 181602=DAOM 197198]|nr:hypothetical protein RIR_jg8708.t1 [Rhizophagus irregularis DAOM 181602=DAOM 197198]
MDFRCFDFGKRTEIMSSTSESEMECRTKLRFGLWKKGSGRLDEMNRFRTFETRNEPVSSGRLDNGNRNEPVPDVRMMKTTGSGRLDNRNRNEPVLDVWIMELKTNRFSLASTWHRTLDT